MQEEAEAARAAYAPKYEAVKSINQTIREIESRIAELKDRFSYAENHPLIATERENAEKLREKLKTITADYHAKKERSEPLGRLLRRAENYVADLRDPSKLTLAPEAPAPKLARASDITTEIEKTRTKIGKLKDERSAVENAPIPSKQAKQIVASFVDALAGNGRPDLWPVIEGGRFPMLPRDTRAGALLPGAVEAPIDVVGLICWAFRDQIVDAFQKAIDEDADDSAALSAEDRKTRLEGIERELLSLERQDEALLAVAREHLVMVPRREDADIRAVLGVEGPAPAED